MTDLTPDTLLRPTVLSAGLKLRFQRANADIYDFHARLCQVIGNFFADDTCLYSYPAEEAQEIGSSCDNGHFQFLITVDGYRLMNRTPEKIAAAKEHEYWTDSERTIFDSIDEVMPKQKPLKSNS